MIYVELPVDTKHTCVPDELVRRIASLFSNFSIDSEDTNLFYRNIKYRLQNGIS